MASKKRNLRVVASSESITVESVVSDAGVHASQLDFEDEFEALLDAEGDEEFGEIALRDKSETKGEVLKNWTSQDFSNIYVRFRPNLERYAKRWLNNQSQIDEVVQDAFLYLMVTLPELDSEVGVLRFLKWKLRLLCLDVLRASGRAYINNIDDHHDALVADLPEHSSALEAADDAAVVRLALSKLTPRHREVLLATMYEEKSIAQVAEQVALSENATRQLIFRARAAFKVALIGDVDTSGMNAGAILSVAARKAAAEGRKVGAQVMVILFVLAIAVGSFLTFGGRSQAPEAPIAEAPQNGAGTGGASSTVLPGDGQNQAQQQLKSNGESQTVDFGANTSSAFAASAIDNVDRSSYVNEAALVVAANLGTPQTMNVFPASAPASTPNAVRYTVSSGKYVTATFEVSKITGVTSLPVTFLADGIEYTTYAQDITTKTDSSGNLVITGTLGDLLTGQDVVLNGTDLQGALITIMIQQSGLTNANQTAVLTITPKSHA